MMNLIFFIEKWYVHTRANSGNKMESDSGPSGKMEDLV